MYSPGSHILAELSVTDATLLKDYTAFKQLIDDLVHALQLEKIGEVYHSFDSAGYTGLVCLTESHISIHTWPEFNRLTYDVFLSNFKRDNTEKVHTIHQGILELFGGEIINQHELKR